MPVNDRQSLAVQAVLIGAMAVWGLNLTSVKWLTAWFEPTMLACVRMLVACIALTAIVVVKRCARMRFTVRQWAAMGLCAVFMVYANQVLFAQGLQRSTATNAALVMALSPLASALLAALLFREPLTLQRGCGVLLGFAGVAAVVLSHPGSGLSSAGVGDLLIICSVVSFAAGGALVQRLARQIHPLTLCWITYCIGTVLLVVHLALGPSDVTVATLFPGWWPWVLVLFSGIFATALCNVIWNQAIATIGVARTAVFLYWVPVFGVLFAALLLGEQLTLWHLVGFAAVMGGTWLGTRRPVAVAPAVP